VSRVLSAIFGAIVLVAAGASAMHVYDRSHYAAHPDELFPPMPTPVSTSLSGIICDSGQLTYVASEKQRRLVGGYVKNYCTHKRRPFVLKGFVFNYARECVWWGDERYVDKTASWVPCHRSWLP